MNIATYVRDAYAAVDAEYDRQQNEDFQREIAIDKIASEILDDVELFDEAIGEYDDLRIKFLKACLKCGSWGARNDRAEQEAVVKEIKGAMVDIAWEYAERLLDMRIKDADEY